MSINRVNISGHLTRDPELRATLRRSVPLLQHRGAYHLPEDGEEPTPCESRSH